MKKKIGIMLIIIVLILSSIVLAEEEKFNVSLVSNTSEIAPGETIELDVKLTNIKLQDGIISYIGEIQFDEDVFELKEIKEADGWDTMNVSSSKKRFLSYTKSREATKEDQIVAKIKLKAKTTAKVGESTVTLTYFEVANQNEGAKIISEKKYRVNIQKKEEENTQENNNTNNQTENTNENTNNNTNTNTQNNNTNQENNTQNNQNTENNNTNNQTENTNNNTNTDNNTTNTNKEEDDNTNEKTNTEEITEIENIEEIEGKNTNNTQTTAEQEDTINGKLPQTGENDKLIMPLILVAGILMIIFYKKYQQYREI